ncbi:helix-turn-helix domain-containing protein [Bacillus infantis]|uniref:helix-turn-helix domain-containing protein n=1 Tax=Bacillus infantis TaxID=324767 RepID=UPI00321A210C
MDEYKFKVGQRMKSLRKKKKIPVQTILDKFGIARSTYTGWEMGRRTPNGQTLVDLAELFGTTVDYITGKTEDDGPLAKVEVKDLMKTKLTYNGKDITEEQREALEKMFEAFLGDNR